MDRLTPAVMDELLKLVIVEIEDALVDLENQSLEPPCYGRTF